MIIINADDWGLSVEATDAMLEEARQSLAPNIVISPADASRPVISLSRR